MLPIVCLMCCQYNGVVVQPKSARLTLYGEIRRGRRTRIDVGEDV